jgi:cytochrome P450
MNLLEFMLAGFKTTNMTLVFCVFALVCHPEEMTKLQEEIDSEFSVDNVKHLIKIIIHESFLFVKYIYFKKLEVNYEKVQKLEYLDMFIKEVMRMYPIGNKYYLYIFFNFNCF